MNRVRWLILVLCLSLLWTPLLKATPDVKPLTVGFSDQDILLEKCNIQGREYDVFRVDDLDLTKQPGCPRLPIKPLHFYVPMGKRVAAVNIESLRSRRLPGSYMIMPAQREVPFSSGTVPQPVGPDPAVYSLSKPYPSSPVKIGVSGTMAGRHITTIEVYPLQYIPAEATVIVNEMISIAVTFEDETDLISLPRETKKVRQLRNEVVGRYVENPDDIDMDFACEIAGLTDADAIEYLIVCVNEHVETFEILKYWKTRKGVPTAIETYEGIDSTYSGRDLLEKVRNSIRDYYLNHGTIWVLIVGRPPSIPGRMCYAAVYDLQGEEIMYETELGCDLYFADVDGDWNFDGDEFWGELEDSVDLYPDVYVSRFPRNDAVKCSIAVDKVLTYEGFYSIPTDYQLDMLFMAEFLDDWTDHAVLKNIIEDESVPPRFDPITKLYQRDGNLGHTSAMNKLNQGFSIVNHCGHGADNMLSIGFPTALTVSDMTSLTNGPRYSVFYSPSCNSANFCWTDACFGEAFLISPGGGGFYIGNTDYGFYETCYPGAGTGDLYDREFFMSMFKRGNTNLGLVHADAKSARAWRAVGYCTERWTQFALTLFGDPETPIWKNSPLNMTVSHIDSIEAASQTFSVSVSREASPVKLVRVCLWKGDEIYEVGETDLDGNIDFQVSPSDTGTMLVTATKNRYIPYMGSCYVYKVNAGLNRIDNLAEALCVTVSPNPVFHRARIDYRLASDEIRSRPQQATLSMYDACGRHVKSLTLKHGDSSLHTIKWDGCSESGQSVPPGIYFARLSVGRREVTTKFVYLR